MAAVRRALGSLQGQREVALLRRRLKECQGAVAELEQVSFVLSGCV